MTAQIHDRLAYLGQDYELLTVSGGGLADPLSHGLQPSMLHTACWRGYFCLYTIIASRLVWSELTVRSQEGAYPEIAGVRPSVDPAGVAVYRGLDIPLRFSGRILAGKDFLPERYVHMGFQAPSAYASLLELAFTDGRLTSAAQLAASPSGPEAGV